MTYGCGSVPLDIPMDRRAHWAKDLWEWPGLGAELPSHLATEE